MNDSDPGLETRPRQQRPMPQRQAPLRRPPLCLPAAPELQGFVERGVETAYTVIDAYLRRGQQAAQRVAPAAPLPGMGSLGGLGGLGGLGAQLAGSAPWGAAASSIAGPWLQLLRAWADVVASLGPLAGGAGAGDALPPGFMAAGAAAPSPSGASQAAGAAPTTSAPTAATAGPRAKVTIELVSRRGAEVSVSLEPGADLAALQAEWLSDGAEPAGSAPGSLALYSEPGHVHLRLTLAEPPPPGRHEARLCDSQGQAWGSVVLSIAPAAASTGPASA